LVKPVARALRTSQIGQAVEILGHVDVDLAALERD
jgi:hypothetical protein